MGLPCHANLPSRPGGVSIPLQLLRALLPYVSTCVAWPSNTLKFRRVPQSARVFPFRFPHELQRAL